MVSMVESPLCARVCVHFKNPDFSYFVAYIAHFRVLVNGFDCDVFHKLGFANRA